MATWVYSEHPASLSSPPQTRRQKTSCSYVEFLSENSICSLPKTPSADPFEQIPSESYFLIDGNQAINVNSDVRTELLYDGSRKPFGSKPVDYPLEMGTQDTKASVHLRNRDRNEGSENVAGFSFSDRDEKVKGERYSGPVVDFLGHHADSNGGPPNAFSSTMYQIPAQNHASFTRGSNKSTVAATGSQRKSQSATRARAIATDRRRRLRIAERVKALQELLPDSGEGGQAAVLEDIINHIKYLQLQIKDLSQMRLGGERSSESFIFLEGCGHYILHEKMMNEPLEEIMGNLLELNPSAATQLLESRGLFMMPMTLVEGLHRAI